MARSQPAPAKGFIISTHEEVAHRRTLGLESVTDADLTAILRKMVELAKEGDVPGARLVLQHTLGRPIEQPHSAGRRFGDGRSDVPSQRPALRRHRQAHNDREAQAAVNQRSNQPRPKPTSDGSPMTVTETESPRLIDPATTDQKPADRRAANKGR